MAASDGRISRRQLAALLGVRLNAVQYATNEGRLEGTYVKDERGTFRYDEAAAVQRWAETSKTGRGVRRSSRAPPTEAQEAAADELSTAAADATTIDETERLLSAENLRHLDLMEATRIEKILKAKKLKLEYDQAAGVLVLKAQVTKEAFDEAKRVRQALSSLPSRLRSQGLDAAMARTLEKELDRALEGLAR